MQQGRCPTCKVAYTWRFPTNLKEGQARCPKCDNVLRRTTHEFKGPWIDIQEGAR